MTAKVLVDRFREPPKTPEHVLAKSRAYYYANRERLLAEAKGPERKEYMRKWRADPENKRRGADMRRSRVHFEIGLYDALLEFQGDRCAICERPFNHVHQRGVHADHCHDQRAARGLLCMHCNQADGNLRATGLTPDEYARRHAAYVADTPVQRMKRGALHGR